MKEAERFLILSNIDRLWKEHLQALKFVQQAVSLRGYAQRDPLIEYKLEGYNLFLEMMAQIRRNVIYSIYQVCIKPCIKIRGISRKIHYLICEKFSYFQFQPMLVKNDKEETQSEKSGKLVSNGRGGKKNPNPVGAAEPSASAASPQASA